MSIDDGVECVIYLSRAHVETTCACLPYGAVNTTPRGRRLHFTIDLRLREHEEIRERTAVVRAISLNGYCHAKTAGQ